MYAILEPVYKSTYVYEVRIEECHSNYVVSTFSSIEEIERLNSNKCNVARFSLLITPPCHGHSTLIGSQVDASPLQKKERGELEIHFNLVGLPTSRQWQIGEATYTYGNLISITGTSRHMHT